MSRAEMFLFYSGALTGCYVVIITSSIDNHLTPLWKPIVWLAFWLAIEFVAARIKKARAARKAANS